MIQRARRPARRPRTLHPPPAVPRLQELQWAAARIVFFSYIAFSMATVVGGFLTAPVMTWYFFGDWRFWRHWHSAKGLFPHAYKMLFKVLDKGTGNFMLDVPLTAEPHTSVDRERVQLAASWEFGNSCGPCSRCCTKINCPILDREMGLCRGYNAFFWRYFNCGRFPSAQREIDYYVCPKWEMKPVRSEEAPRDVRPSKVA